MGSHGYGADYDYVVVGAGAAGCVVARRLLESLDCRVLLLEAGGPDDAPSVHDTAIPSMTSMWGAEDFSWGYRTVPQPGLGGRRVDIPQGRIVGGGTSINAMMYVRGNRRDYDRWSRMGNEGWGYEEVLPYFKRSEDFEDGESEYRGAGGPLSVVRYGRPSEVSMAFVAAVEEWSGRTGADRVAGGVDYNGARQEGVGFYYQSTRSKDNRRASTAVGFLHPVLGHRNLTVATRARATRVLFEGTRAVGVEYTTGSRVHRVRAAAEVIVSCGALASPALLMLSGLGPAGHLREHGIAPLADLPGVGAGLQDHLLFGVAYESPRELAFPELLAEAGVFLHTRPPGEEDSPDLQFFFGPVQFVDERYRTDRPGFTFAPILARPQSRGTVTLRSADPGDLPVVDPRYLDRQADLDVLVRGIEIARELVGTAPFAPFRGRELAPGADADDLAGYARASASTVWHPVGTCRMGRDGEAVVDPRLSVHGVTGLRVVDASIMPTITAGNTNAPTIMIAEKAADMIAEDAHRI
ncbi:GMC family oxidoreductase [Planomonospora algeriensis]